MRIIQSSIFRAVIAIVVGVLLVKYREDTMKWLTIVAGLMFFLSGTITLIVYYYERKRTDKVLREANKQATTMPTTDDQRQESLPRRPFFPFVGLGSTILGIILAAMPADFIIGVTYVLAGMLIIGAIQQLVSLFMARRFASIPILFWIFPLVILVIGILVVAHPMETATLPLKIIGWALMLYGVVECINAVKIHIARKKYLEEEEARIVRGQIINDIEDATIVEEEEKSV